MAQPKSRFQSCDGTFWREKIGPELGAQVLQASASDLSLAASRDRAVQNRSQWLKAEEFRAFLG
jgi:hypothetical protein